MSPTKLFYTLIGGFSLLQSQLSFANTTTTTTTNRETGTAVFGIDKTDKFKVGGDSATSAGDAIGNIIVGLMAIVSIIAVGYVIYAGSQILTAGGDEEKVKTARKTIVNVFVGIVVMWLAYWIVSLVIGAIG